MQEMKLNELFEKWQKGQITPEERTIFLDYLEDESSREIMLPLLEAVQEDPLLPPYYSLAAKELLVDSILKQYPAQKAATISIHNRTSHRIHFLKTAWFRYAAAIIIMLGIGSYLWFTNTASNPVNQKNPLNPSSDNHNYNKATLILSDGSTILLDSAANGNVAQQGNTIINKLANGQIEYNLKGINGGKVMMNTMSTPKGGQYQLTLPDGSKVWLNAASSIRFPTAFTDKERNVEITGEAYMEIEKNPKQPFSVHVNGVKIDVLGTSFNVNAYSDETSIKTTLISGSIKVISNANEVILKPSQQAVVNTANESPVNPKIRLITVQTTNTEQVLAWKNGFFNLQDMSLEEVGRQLERWYNIEVKYEGNLQEKRFRGKLGRDVRLSTVLNWFSKLGIRNRMEGRTLILSID